MKLFKVKADIDVIVLAEDGKSAISVAKNNIQGEIDYANYKVFSVDQMTDIPDDWKGNIPYYPFGVNEVRKCSELLRILGETQPSEKPKEKKEKPKEKTVEDREKLQKEPEEPSRELLLEEKSIPPAPSRPRGGPLPDDPHFGTMPGLKFQLVFMCNCVILINGDGRMILSKEKAEALTHEGN